MRARVSRWAASAPAIAVGAIAIAGLSVPAHSAVVTAASGTPASWSASADDAGGDLEVDASPVAPQFLDLSPGDRRYWPLEANLEGAESGTLAVRVHGAGALIEHPRHGLTISVESCSGGYAKEDPDVRPRCSGTSATVLSRTPLKDVTSQPTDASVAHVWQLPDILLGRPRHLLVTLGLPGAGADDESLMGLSGEFGVGLYASGNTFRDAGDPVLPTEDATPPPGEPAQPSAPAAPAGPGVHTPNDGPGFGLPATGGPQAVLMAVAAGLVGLGTALYRRNRREVTR
jgi:hypothetical protein